MKRLAQYFMNSRPTLGYNDWPVFVYYRFIKKLYHNAMRPTNEPSREVPSRCHS